MSEARSGRWLVSWSDRPDARLRLFCLPFAGGSASIYRHWANALPDDIGVYGVQLPGRESRIREPAYKRMDSLVARLANELQPFIDRPYVLFGHSMGAAIAFETARQLISTFGLPPQQLLVSGRRAPGLPSVRPPSYQLSDEAFTQRLRELNGTPSEVLEHPELMELLLPVLRADFELDDTYEMLPGPALGCDLSVIGATDDTEVSSDELSAWSTLSGGLTTVTVLRGGHFHITQDPEGLLDAVRSTLSKRPNAE
ncbi:MAG: medium-chain acyl-[acyl-carrier-protein] hydrolase [Gammaproteobacteria bacterium]